MIFYPLNPEDAPTAAELAADEADARLRILREPVERDEDGFAISRVPYDPTEPF